MNDSDLLAFQNSIQAFLSTREVETPARWDELHDILASPHLLTWMKEHGGKLEPHHCKWLLETLVEVRGEGIDDVVSPFLAHWNQDVRLAALGTLAFQSRINDQTIVRLIRYAVSGIPGAQNALQILRCQKSNRVAKAAEEVIDEVRGLGRSRVVK